MVGNATRVNCVLIELTINSVLYIIKSVGGVLCGSEWFLMLILCGGNSLE